MTLRQVLRPKEPFNFGLTAGICVFFLAAYLFVGALSPWSPKRGLGLVAGILAALLFVFEMGYPLRRPRARPFGKAKRWLQLHIYLGVIAFLGVLIHCDFSLPHGGMGWALLLLSAWTSLTGLVGVWLQKWVPSVLSDGLRVEALYERIPNLVERLTGEADALVGAATNDVLERFYQGEVRPRLAGVTPSWSYVLDVRRGRDRALEPFKRVSQFVGEETKGAVEDLEQIYEEKLQLDASYSLQGILRRWLIFHAPPAGLLMGLLFVHILSWVLY
jgi:hypothetical protein